MTDKNREFKILVLPRELNDTPRGEDLVLIITKEEFLRMWRRGQTMLRNQRLKRRTVDVDFTGSITVS
jgi:hypothetical protein